MNKLYSLILKLATHPAQAAPRSYAACHRTAARDERGQDMVELLIRCGSPLLAGFIAVASAGSILPGISGSISTIFSKMASLVANAALA